MANGGNAPVLVFVDAGGAFTKDTECVNGVRGNAADHLTKDVVPFMVSTFGVSTHSANWGIAGWSMGGTCAVTLTVMHPELFSAFVDIGGDVGPNAGTKEQTVERLFNGDEAAWASFDPTTVMTRHGRYTRVSGVFAIEGPVVPGGARRARGRCALPCCHRIGERHSVLDTRNPRQARLERRSGGIRADVRLAGRSAAHPGRPTGAASRNAGSIARLARGVAAHGTTLGALGRHVYFKCALARAAEDLGVHGAGK